MSSIPVSELMRLLFATIGLGVSVLFFVTIELVAVIFGIGFVSLLISRGIRSRLNAVKIATALTIIGGILAASLLFEQGATVVRIALGTWTGFSGQQYFCSFSNLVAGNQFLSAVFASGRVTDALIHYTGKIMN